MASVVVDTSRPTEGVTRPAPRLPARSSALVSILIVEVLTAVAAVLRLWHGDVQSLRLDEGFTLRWATSPLSPIMHGKTLLRPSLFQLVGADVHPPGYFLMLHFWIQAFGTNLEVLRLPSEIAGIAAVPVLYLLAATLYNRVVAVFAGLMGAVSPFWIWHAQEARMYSFLLLFTLLSTYGLVVAFERRQRWGWALFFLASLLAIYTQYYAFLVLFAQALYGITAWRRHRPRQYAIWAGCLALLAVSYIPWGLVFLANYRGATDPNLTAPNLYTPLILLSNFLFGYLSANATPRVVAAWPVLVPITLALGGFGHSLSWRARLLWFLFLVPILVAFLVTLTVKPFLSVRYLVVSVPALYILISVALTRVRGRLARLLIPIGIVALSLAAMHIGETAASNPASENYRSAVDYIQSHIRPGDVVALDAPYNDDAFSYYTHLNAPVYYLPFPLDRSRTRLTTRYLGRYLNSIMTGRSRLWVLYYLEANYDHRNRVRQYLAYQTAGHQVIIGGPYGRNQTSYPSSFVNVQLIRYDLIPTKMGNQEVRPNTVQEYRAVSYLSQTLRRPQAGPWGRPGASAPMVGTLLFPPHPAKSWHLIPVENAARHPELTVSNLNLFTTNAIIHLGGTHGPSFNVILPARSDVDVNVLRFKRHLARGPITVTSPAPILVERSVIVGKTERYTYARRVPAHGTHRQPS